MEGFSQARNTPNKTRTPDSLFYAAGGVNK